MFQAGFLFLFLFVYLFVFLIVGKHLLVKLKGGFGPMNLNKHIKDSPKIRLYTITLFNCTLLWPNLVLWCRLTENCVPIET